MKYKKSSLSLAALLLIGSISLPAQAEPGGCMKYGAAGAVAGHMVSHAVVGAVGGCITGMYQRHKYHQTLAQKAALWDQEHPADKTANTGWWQSHNSKAEIAQKAQWYDIEHPNGANPPAAPMPAGTAATASMAPASMPSTNK